MNKCLNCDNPLPEGESHFCDSLCKQGYSNRQFKKYNEEFRSRLGY